MKSIQAMLVQKKNFEHQTTEKKIEVETYFDLRVCWGSAHL